MKKFLTAILLFVTFNVFADCPPIDPSNPCPAADGKSRLADALQCGWKIKLIAPADPLTQFSIGGNPIGPNIGVKDGLYYCVYASSDPNVMGYLIHPQNATAGK